MGSLYNFDAELKKKYPNLRATIDSKVVQQLMEKIIYEEPSLDFIKKYLKDKGYLFVDSIESNISQSDNEINNEILKENALTYKVDNSIDIHVKNEATENSGLKVDNEKFEANISGEEVDEEDFDLDAFLESDKFKSEMKNTEKLVGHKNNKILFEKLAKNHSSEIKNDLIVANLSLVRKIASKYAYAPTGSMDYDDLVSEGVIGLMKAIDRYKLEFGYEFSTYAYYWIKQTITRAIADKALTVRLPVHLQETLNKINKLEREFWKEDGEPEIKKIAELCGISPERYYELKIIEATYRRQTSLNTPLKEDSQEDILMMLEQKSSIWFVENLDANDPVQVANYHALQEELSKLFTCLSEREAQVINLRFGIEDNEPLTLEEIGKLLNVTRERIRQIQAKAITKLRKKGVDSDLLAFVRE